MPVLSSNAWLIKDCNTRFNVGAAGHLVSTVPLAMGAKDNLEVHSAATHLRSTLDD